MRIIKFRGICEFGKDFVYGSLIITKIWNGLNEDGTGRNINKYSIKDDNGTIFDNIKPETIGQYTGLKDKNGKEIFEGDIVQKIIKSDYLNKKDWGVYNGIVKLKNGCWICENILDIKNNSGYKQNESLYCFENEIIGNIYETPNLLDNDLLGYN